MKKILFTFLLVAITNNALTDKGYSEENVSTIAEFYSIYKGLNHVCGDYVSMDGFADLSKKVIAIGLNETGVNKSKWEDLKDEAWEQSVIADDYLMYKQLTAYSSSSEVTVMCYELVDQMSQLFRGIVSAAEVPGEKKREF